MCVKHVLKLIPVYFKLNPIMFFGRPCKILAPPSWVQGTIVQGVQGTIVQGAELFRQLPAVPQHKAWLEPDRIRQSPRAAQQGKTTKSIVFPELGDTYVGT